MSRVLVTRPLREAQDTAAALAALGHTAVIEPLLSIEPQAFALPAAGIDRLVLTSGNAVEALAGHPDSAALYALPVTTVGRRTAARARALGFDAVEVGGLDAEALLVHCRDTWPAAQRVLYVAGNDRTVDLPAVLAPFGHRVSVVVSYLARPAERFTPDVAQALGAGRIDAVLHYSARTAAAYIACLAGVPADAPQPLHLCLSAKVAGVLQAAGQTRLRIAAAPEETSLLILLPS